MFALKVNVFFGSIGQILDVLCNWFSVWASFQTARVGPCLLWERVYSSSFILPFWQINWMVMNVDELHLITFQGIFVNSIGCFDVRFWWYAGFPLACTTWLAAVKLTYNIIYPLSGETEKKVFGFGKDIKSNVNAVVGRFGETSESQQHFESIQPRRPLPHKLPAIATETRFFIDLFGQSIGFIGCFRDVESISTNTTSSKIHCLN